MALDIKMIQQAANAAGQQPQQKASSGVSTGTVAGQGASMPAPASGGNNQARIDQLNKMMSDLPDNGYGVGMIRSKIQKELDSLNASNKAGLQGQLDQFYNDTQDLSKQYDPERLYSEYKAPIEENFYKGADQLSSYMARQGLGSSGMNLAGHAQLENNRSAMESQAQKMAIDQSIQGQLSTKMAGLAPELQKYGIDTSKVIAQMQTNAMMEMLQQQMQAGMMGGLGQLAGTLGAAAILA
jgi:hypothetical protein